jgi:hypothetical protein
MRLEEEGAKTKKGAEIRSAEDYTLGKLIGQSLGFQSTTTAELQRKTFKFSQVVREVNRERVKVLDGLDKAAQKFENDPTDKSLENLNAAVAAIKFYNYKNGLINPIEEKTIERSLESRAERREEAIDGLMLSPVEAELYFEMTNKSRVDR